MLLSPNLKNGVTVVSTNKILPSKILFFCLKTAKHNKKTQKNAFFSKKGLQKVYLHGNINKHSEVLE